MRVLLLIIFQLLMMNFSEAHMLSIYLKPIEFDETRLQLTREYSLEHYGREMTEIEPQAIVVHWTASATFESAYKHFYNSADPYDGTLNVASHFIIDRNGKIYQLTSETALNRHAIGYNWCAIGIENVGGVDGEEDLTESQLRANIEIIRHMKAKHKNIKYVFGHYQQDIARQSGLYIELVDGYYAEKIDPGKKFMTALRDELGDEFIFFEP